MRPLIAVIGRRAGSVSGLRFSGTVAAEAVCDAVLAAGGEPLILHGGGRHTAADLAQRLAVFAGVVLPGGSDLNPARYGQEPRTETEPADDAQDELDLAVARAVLAIDLPTLAICRGMQVLNIACGGTLTQHLAEATVRHRDAVHDVRAAADSRLRAVVGTDVIAVSSYHHQGVDRVGRDLRVVARSDDSCIEALEHTKADVLAVQWHPEDLTATSPHDRALFADLVARARTREEAAA